MTFLASGPFWLASVERAIKTAAQTAVGVLTADVTGLLEVDWAQGASVAGLAALVSLLTSIGSGAVTDGSPSLASEHLYRGDHAAHPHDRPDLR